MLLEEKESAFKTADNPMLGIIEPSGSTVTVRQTLVSRLSLAPAMQVPIESQNFSLIMPAHWCIAMIQAACAECSITGHTGALSTGVLT